MNIHHAIKLALLASALSACGGSDSPDIDDPVIPPPEAVTLEGKVADGYLVGARVCLDLNLNKICDDGEPSTISTAGGSFSIEGATTEQIAAFPLLVEVEAGVIDEDTGEAITEPYSMTAPAGYEFVSPLTTMVQNEVEQGTPLETAEADLKTLLRTELDLTEDYVASQADDNLSEEAQQEYQRLHQIAQVTAKVIASNLDLIQASAEAANVSVDDIIGIIVDTVIEALDDIVSEVEFANQQDGEFDPDDVAASEVIQDSTTVSTDDLEEQVEIRDAQASAAAANLTELVTGEGINFFEGDYHDDRLELEYGTLLYNSETDTTTETIYVLLEGAFVLDDEDHDGEDLILTEQGWVMASDNFTLDGLNDDGSITLGNPDFPLLSETITAKQISIAGLNAGLFLSAHEETYVWHKVLPETLVFSEGAQAFELMIRNDNDIYAIFNWDGCEQQDMVEGMCNSVWAHTSGSTDDGPAVTLQSLISASASDGTVDAIVGPHVAWDGSKTVIAEIIGGGEVKYHKIQWQAQSDTGEVISSATLLASGSWREVSLSGATMLLLDLPDVVRHFGEHHDDDGEMLLTEYQGAVRRGEFIAAGEEDDDALVFNLVAKNDIINNIDLTLLDTGTDPQPDLSGFVCRDGDSDWDDSSDTPVTATLKSLAEYRALVANCRDSSEHGFNADMLAGYQLKSYDSDGTLENILWFSAGGSGSFIDYHDEQPSEQGFGWGVNEAGELIIEMLDSAGELEVKVVLNLIDREGDYLSVKGFLEDTEWAPMDGTLGEVWSDKLKLFAQ